MEKEYQRNTVFLYPDLTKCSQEERLCTLNLITKLTAVVKMANRQLKDLIEGGKFSFVNCMPEVYMHCVSDDPATFGEQDNKERGKKQDNVRICVTNFDGHDYTENYQELVRKYKAGETNISHLVALDLSTIPRGTQFSPDNNEKFNAVISTSMESLETVLVSIMFDISLYHYFLLSDDLRDRKKFNEVKYKYIINQFTQAEQRTHYGAVLSSDRILYLPISLPKVKIINRRTKIESRQDAVEELLKMFATFLARSISLQVIRDEQGNIMDSSDELPREIYKDIECIVRENAKLGEYIIVFLPDSTEKAKPFILEFDNDGVVPSWITKDCEGKTIQNIILVRQGDEQ